MACTRPQDYFTNPAHDGYKKYWAPFLADNSLKPYPPLLWSMLQRDKVPTHTDFNYVIEAWAKQKGGNKTSPAMLAALAEANRDYGNCGGISLGSIVNVVTTVGASLIPGGSIVKDATKSGLGLVGGIIGGSGNPQTAETPLGTNTTDSPALSSIAPAVTYEAPPIDKTPMFLAFAMVGIFAIGMLMERRR